MGNGFTWSTRSAFPGRLLHPANVEAFLRYSAAEESLAAIPLLMCQDRGGSDGPPRGCGICCCCCCCRCRCCCCGMAKKCCCCGCWAPRCCWPSMMKPSFYYLGLPCPVKGTAEQAFLPSPLPWLGVMEGRRREMYRFPSLPLGLTKNGGQTKVG